MKKVSNAYRDEALDTNFSNRNSNRDEEISIYGDTVIKS